MLGSPCKKTVVSLAMVMFFALAGKTWAADAISQVEPSASLWSQAAAANIHLGFPDESSASPSEQLVSTASTAAWEMTNQQTFVPLPSSGWAGLGIMMVMVCRKPILRLVS